MKNTRFDALKTVPANSFTSDSSRDRQNFRKDKLRSRARQNIFPVLPKKKVYTCTDADFPELASTKTLANVLDFAKVIPSNDAENEVVDNNAEIGGTPPGWVRIYRENGQIEFNYTPKSPSSAPPTPAQTDHNDQINLTPLAELVQRWEQERAEQNDLFGDMSPYWNTELYQ